MDRKAHWDNVYATKVAHEVGWFQPRPETSLQLIARSGIGREEPLIDVGGGASLLVDRLLDEGWTDVSVLDISPSALSATGQRLGERAGRVHWLQEDAARFAPPRRYAVWHDRAAFHFLTDPAEQAAYVKAATDGVRPGGCLVVATFGPDGPEKCSGLPVVRYAPADLAQVFGGGFDLAETLEELHTTPWGALQQFVYCRFVRR